MMKAATVEVEAASFRTFGATLEVAEIPAAAARSRLADYLELTKPRIATMALFTVAIGYLLGAGSGAEFLVLIHTLIGAGLVAAGGGALNHWLERDSDARMQRTMRRPLPSGRMSTAEVFTFGMTLGAIGLFYLFLVVSFAAGLVAAATLVSYVAIYTPLKTVTSWNTIVGAMPGALPPVIGWAAARGWDGLPGAAALFLVLFIWQIPHFLAIAWMYRADYARGGLKMLPTTDPSGSRTAWVMVLTCAALIPVGLFAVGLGVAGPLSVVGCAVFGLLFLREAVRFDRNRSDCQARRVLRASLLYLPAALGMLLIENMLPRFFW